MSPKKWIKTTGAVEIVSKAGHDGGTYAHSNLAMSFATWISPEFQLYIEIFKLNYRIHIDAIKENLLPSELTLA